MKEDEKGLYIFFLIAGILMQLHIFQETSNHD